MSGASQPTGVSAIVGFGFFTPQLIVSSLPHLEVFHAGVAVVAVAGTDLEVAAGFAGVAVGVEGEDTADLIAANWQSTSQLGYP